MNLDEFVFIFHSCLIFLCWELWRHLKGQFLLKCKFCHNLLTLMLFQTQITFVEMFYKLLFHSESWQ